MITKKQVSHVAKLARLGLTKEEKEKFTEELSTILDFVNKLDEVKADKIKPTAQATGLENVMRKDKGRSKSKQEIDKLLELVPETEKGYVKVKAVL